MIYQATVEHYQEWNDQMVTDYMFIAANSTVKAVEQVSNYFGENCLEAITISPFSPDDFLIVSNEELFHDFALHAGDNVCWQENSMARKINKDYVNQYRKIILTQPLAHGKYIQQVYTKEGLTWKVTHTTNSAYHICPYDGIFRNCKDCGALEDDFDIKYCLKKQQLISSGALSNRVNDCLNANLEVQFIDQKGKTMTNTEKFDMVNDLLTEIQHMQSCYRNDRFTGNCNCDCRYMACTDSGDSFCMIDAILDETYRDFGLWEIN